MARFACFPTFHIGKRKKSKGLPEPVELKLENANGALQVIPEDFVHQCMDKVAKGASSHGFADTSNKGSKSSEIEKSATEETPVRAKVEVESAYEGSDEHDEILSLKRDYSDLDLQGLADNKQLKFQDSNRSDMYELEQKSEKGDESEKCDEGTTVSLTPEVAIQSGHLSDPGMGRIRASWGSPKLQRSCSNIETRRRIQLTESSEKSHSYNDLQTLLGFTNGHMLGVNGSPQSLVSKSSADKVMLKKQSSSQVLPSRSRNLWWKLFLWSHRNLHKPLISSPRSISYNNDNSNSNRRAGYCSDTLESKSRDTKALVEHDNEIQWMAFSAASSAATFDRVNAWVNSLDDSNFCPVSDEHIDDEEANYLPLKNSFEIGESSGKICLHAGKHVPQEVAQANAVIQSLNLFSTVAHISGMGLKVIPSISAFSSLRAVNLSGNFIVQISAGSLPKSLHILDLSRNKIATIDGLRELTRLRVLNLSYNRISRIGHGLSNCTRIKELYIAGNKISDVEGLHRLSKLSVFDLSFNKITTTKALGQLVANYSTLQALNLVGNPIQSNIGDDQLRKAVCGLLPLLIYLNKQPIKPQRVREVAKDSLAKAALGSSSWNSRRRATRGSSQSVSSLVHRGSTRSVTVSGQRRGGRHG